MRSFLKVVFGALARGVALVLHGPRRAFSSQSRNGESFAAFSGQVDAKGVD